MIDYIYSNIAGITPEDFLSNSQLQFYANVNLDTAEISTFKNSDRKKRGYVPKEERKAEYKHCNFFVTNNKYINFSGSVHEYFNNGDNSTDFTFFDLFTVTKDLSEKFKINPFLEALHNVEFGVNILLPFDTQTLINSILCFKGREYELKQFKGKGHLLKFCFDQYELKIYDKGLQKCLNKNLLRFEIKVKTMHFLRAKKIPIYDSADLLSPAIHKKLGKLLIDFWRQLIICDLSINIQDAKPREQTILKDGQNPKYWPELQKTNPELYKKRLKRFRVLSLKYGKANPQRTVLNLVENKWKELTQIEPGQLKEVNSFLKSFQTNNFPQNNRPIKEGIKPTQNQLSPM
jgi:hypothetical protein